MDRFFFWMLALVPVAIFVSSTNASPTLVFFLSALAIIPLAKYIGEATEEVANRTSPAMGGLISATFGNATELIIGFLALNAGLIDIVKASITGSIISNLLLVLGFAMFAGGWKREKQTFNRTGVLAAGSTLFIAAVALIMPAIFASSASGAVVSAGSIEDVSLFVSVLLLCMYVANLTFSLHTHKHLYAEEGQFEPKWPLWRGVSVLLVATLAVAWVSNGLVASIEPLAQSLGWSDLFVGVIVIAIVGNAAENLSAVRVALKNRMDLSLQIAIGSATQIAMLVAPLLVLAGYFLGQPMNLIFTTLELASITLSVLAINFIVADGESNWLEGVQLLVAYVIIAVAFFFHP